MDFKQFNVDVPRLKVFFGEEWFDSTDPDEVWERLLQTYSGNEEVTRKAAYYFTQQSLAQHYIEEAMEMLCTGNVQSDEHLLSHGYHTVVVDPVTGILEVTKDFIYTCIIDGESYDIDVVTLTLKYDPWADDEYPPDWRYTINTMMNHRGSLILNDSSLFNVESVKSLDLLSDDLGFDESEDII
jgi:hypothetical protein